MDISKFLSYCIAFNRIIWIRTDFGWRQVETLPTYITTTIVGAQNIAFLHSWASYNLGDFRVSPFNFNPHLMTSLESWIKVPPYATSISRDGDDYNILQTSLVAPPSPKAAKNANELPSGRARSDSSSSLTTNLTNAVLAAALNVPAPSTPSDPRKTAGRLLSTRDSLSIPITAVNFRRFVSKSGAVFWLQDRVEEVIFWRRGWKVTASWMVAYSFLCKANHFMEQ
jgi:hypothetical protein